MVLTSRTLAEIQAVADEVGAKGGRALAVVSDGRKHSDVHQAVARALDTFGRVDVLVNNAGAYGPIGPFAETDLDSWWDALETNLGAVVRFCRLVIPQMMVRQTGSIINLSGG